MSADKLRAFLIEERRAAAQAKAEAQRVNDRSAEEFNDGLLTMCDRALDALIKLS